MLTPEVVAEGLIVAPGGRSSQRFGEKLFESGQAQTVEDVAFTSLEAGGEFVNAFGAFGAPFAPLSSKRSSVTALETKIVAESSAAPSGRIVPVEAPISRELKVGDVMSYREYLARRTRGSSLRGPHLPQAKRLEEMGIDPFEGTIVVMENKVVGSTGEKLGHTGTRTFGAGGCRTAAAECGKPLSFSETRDLLDPPVTRLGPEVGMRIQELNRKKFPNHY
jgi:hypothetical protein